MKRTHFFSITFLLGALLVLGAVKASAQGSIAPSSQLGVGVNVGAGVGAKIQYAINPSFQIGGGLSFASNSGGSTTGIEAYVRFLLEGQVNPIIQAGFTTTSQKIDGAITNPAAVSGLYGGVGIEYFINRNVGVYGLVNILELQLDPSSVTTFGIMSPRLGLEWYFK